MIHFNSLHAHICCLRTQSPPYAPVATDEKQESSLSLFARSGRERKRAVVASGGERREAAAFAGYHICSYSGVGFLSHTC